MGVEAGRGRDWPVSAHWASVIYPVQTPKLLRSRGSSDTSSSLPSSTETVIKDLPGLPATGQTAAGERLIGQEESHQSRWAPVWDPTWTNNVGGAGMGGAAGPEGARRRHTAVLVPRSASSALNRSSWTRNCRWTCTQHTATLLHSPPTRSQTHTWCVSASLSVTSLSGWLWPFQSACGLVLSTRCQMWWMSPRTAAASAPPPSPPPCTRQTSAPGSAYAWTLQQRLQRPPWGTPSGWTCWEWAAEEAWPPRLFSCCSSSAGRAQGIQLDERLPQFLQFAAVRVVWVETPPLSLTPRFPERMRSHIHPQSSDPGHHQEPLSAPPSPACFSCLFSCQGASPEVWKGFREWQLLGDLLVRPLVTFGPSSPHPGSHDYCGR